MRAMHTLMQGFKTGLFVAAALALVACSGQTDNVRTAEVDTVKQGLDYGFDQRYELVRDVSSDLNQMQQTYSSLKSRVDEGKGTVTEQQRELLEQLREDMDETQAQLSEVQGADDEEEFRSARQGLNESYAKAKESFNRVQYVFAE